MSRPQHPTTTVTITVGRAVLGLWHRAHRMAYTLIERLAGWAGHVDTGFMLTD
ncbi:hypothetical protein [Kitasatospora sp. KL5]|uniref:hypothetical protein n=1 Tax=Kitasatospora sp. KL5 TaxID=3425125 RepID=UPI003D6EB97F